MKTKDFAKLTLSILFTSLLCACNSVKMEYTQISVKAPFDMPAIKVCKFPKQDFIITDFGAKADGSDSTQAINNAIATCSQSGGGRVVVPAGTWFTKAIHFKSNVNLHLQENAVLEFSDNPTDYLPAVMTSWEGLECYNYSPLLYAFKCENIAITGKGKIAPKMDNWKVWFKRPPEHYAMLKDLYTKASTNVPVIERQVWKNKGNLRPHLIQFNRCKNVMLEGITIREAPFWTIHLYMCNNGYINNINVKAHGHNNDGVDFEMSKNILVENSVFDQGDDAFVVKAGRNADAWRLNTPSENIVIRNCEVRNGHTLLGIGSELSGGIRNIYLHDCKVPNNVWRMLYVKTNHRRGGNVDNIYVENIDVKSVRFYVLAVATDVVYQWKDFPDYETRITGIKNLSIKNINCGKAEGLYKLMGDARNPIKSILLENVRLDKATKTPKIAENTNDIKELNVSCTE